MRLWNRQACCGNPSSTCSPNASRCWSSMPGTSRRCLAAKTDVADSEWLADLLQHGLLRASFIPDRAQRDLRDLTRTRTSLIDERSRTVRRLQKVLEDANIKL